MNKYFIFLAIASISIFSSCSRKGCTDIIADNYDPDAKKNCCCEYSEPDSLYSNMKLQVVPFAFGQPFAYNQTFTTTDGRKLFFTKVKFYISNIHLEEATGKDYTTDEVMLFEPGKNIIDLDSIPHGQYTKLSFIVGVDSVTNKTTLPADYPAGHPLAETDMHWSWNTGYIFVKLEGEIDTNKTPDGIIDNFFLYHLGTDLVRRTVAFNYVLDVPFDVAKNITLKINADLGEYFNGLDLSHQINTQTLDKPALAAQIADNTAKVFSKSP